MNSCSTAMVQSKAATVQAYLKELPEERRNAIARVRKVILQNLSKGYDESMRFGMISYEVPLKRCPVTYNKQPLMYAALASQKNYMAVYLMSVYGQNEARFRQAYKKTGKRLDMGKSCVRFRKLDDLPLDLIGKAIASTSVASFIRKYEHARKS